MSMHGWNLGTRNLKSISACQAVFDKLVAKVSEHLIEKGRMRRIRTPPALCLMMALWMIMYMDTFKNCALLFCTSPGVVLYHYLYIIEALREMVPQYVQWPTREERLVIKRELLNAYGYPGVVGMIDGTHTYITAPLEEPNAYVNRHHTHSILTQAVVDHNLLVRDLDVGEAGSLHDSRVFRRSPLGTNLLENDNLLQRDEHILGDGGYILTDNVLIPYDDNGALNEMQTHHNKVLSACRSSVERSFASVKQKFQRLKYFRSLRIEYAVDLIVASCVLHNFIVLEGEDVFRQHVHQPGPQRARGAGMGGNVDADRCLGNFPNVDQEPDHPFLLEVQVMGIEKREEIAARLFENREHVH